MANRFRRLQSGFSLLEVLLSLVILTTLATGIMNVVGFGNRRNSNNTENMQALFLGETFLAEARNEYINTGDIKDTVATKTKAQYEMKDMSATATITCKQDPVPADNPDGHCSSAASGLGLIRVDVNWKPHSGGTNSINLVTYAYRE